MSSGLWLVVAPPLLHFLKHGAGLMENDASKQPVIAWVELGEVSAVDGFAAKAPVGADPQSEERTVNDSPDRTNPLVLASSC